MNTNPITVRSVTSGFRWEAKAGYKVVRDERGDRMSTPPDTILIGWAATEEQAYERAQAAYDDLQ